MPSRLIVKNLPKYMTQERFKSHFESQGTVTDVKLAKTKDGAFRRFGYIGYKNDEDAAKALDYFNKSFIDTCRIQVDFAKSVGDPSLPRPWSRHSQGSSGYDKAHPEIKVSAHAQRDQERAEKKRQEIEKKEKMLRYLYANETDAKLEEFLEVMRPRSAARNQTWANDDVLMATKTKKSRKVASAKTEMPVASDDDLYQDLPGEKKDSQEDLDQSTQEIEQIERPNTIAFDSNVSDLDYLRSKMRVNPAALEAENHAPTEKIHPSRLQQMDSSAALIPQIKTEPVAASILEPLPTKEPEREPTPEPSIPPVTLIGDTGRLFIRNLPYATDPTALETLFSQYGPLTELHLPIYKDTKLQKGFAFVQFMMPEHAVTAYSQLDGCIFQGRLLEILPGKEKVKEEEEASGVGSFKEQKEKRKKMEAGNDFNWNSLFMNSDAVAEAMAKKLNVKKSDILNHEGDNMAVKLALAETHVINETKAYLEEEGVSLSSFQTKRRVQSKTVILVKNLPASTTDFDLQSLFEPFGSLGRVLLPPAKTLALVEFLEPNEAKVAFRKLAYSKFKSVPLFLEWAPADTFESAYDPLVPKVQKAQVEVPKDASTAIKLPESDTDSETTPVATLFVKNLNFDTTPDIFKSHFSHLLGLRSVRIPTKMDVKGGKPLSLGYGFLEFESKEDALRCIKTMQNTELQGHVLNLKFSNASTPATQSSLQPNASASPSSQSQKSQKLIIRNIPFEATKKDIQSLFAAFGQVKSVRLPTKFDGTHRGFGFIEFTTRQEAESAYASLGATHLYGRHLVLEWAQEEGSLDALREKSARGFAREQGMRKRFKWDGLEGLEGEAMEE